MEDDLSPGHAVELLALLYPSSLALLTTRLPATIGRLFGGARLSDEVSKSSSNERSQLELPFSSAMLVVLICEMEEITVSYAVAEARLQYTCHTFTNLYAASVDFASARKWMAGVRVCFFVGSAGGSDANCKIAVKGWSMLFISSTRHSSITGAASVD